MISLGIVCRRFLLFNTFRFRYIYIHTLYLRRIRIILTTNVIRTFEHLLSAYRNVEIKYSPAFYRFHLPGQSMFKTFFEIFKFVNRRRNVRYWLIFA